MKKITQAMCLVLTLITTHNVLAQAIVQTPTPEFISQKMIQKILINGKGELAPGDSANEVYGYKKNKIELDIEVTGQYENISTSSKVNFSIQSESKLNKATKTRIEYVTNVTTPIVGNVKQDGILTRTIIKSIRGNEVEEYIDTTVGEEKVYNVWKTNPVKDYFKAILETKGVPVALTNTILKKIVDKKYIKITKAELDKGVLVSLGLKKDTQLAIDGGLDSGSFQSEQDYVSLFKVKSYDGLTSYEDVMITNLSPYRTATTTTQLHNMTYVLDLDKFTAFLINNKKVNTYTFGILEDGKAQYSEVRSAVESLYKDLELKAAINAKTYELKIFALEPYEISYTSPEGVKLRIVISFFGVEDPTRTTGYIQPIPTKFITLKEIRNMFLKY